MGAGRKKPKLAVEELCAIGALAMERGDVYKPATFHSDSFQRMEPMAIERTLSIIKPDATRRNLTGQINARFEGIDLRVVAQKRIQLTAEMAGQFYAEHAERAFYLDLCEFMTSGPVVVQVLEGENAILRNREVMGATNPTNAEDGTIRKDFGESVEANSVHGSDSSESAAREISFYFSELEIVG